jgi:hypothetical protein
MEIALCNRISDRALASPWIKDRVTIGVTDVDTLEENHWQQSVDFYLRDVFAGGYWG